MSSSGSVGSSDSTAPAQQQQQQQAASALPAAVAPTTANGHASAAPPSSSSTKRVSFALPLSKLSGGDDLSESLLAASFTDSDAHLPGQELATMSTERLRDTRQQKYSTLPQEEDEDASPSHGHSHAGRGHGHSHGSASSSASHSRRESSGSNISSGSQSGTECDHKSHRLGRAHSHSHGGRYPKRGSSRSPSASPESPQMSPDNCGGLKAKHRVESATAANKKARRALILASVFCCIFMILEVVGGIIANSLAIMTDAAHLLSDLAGMLISIFALWLAQRPATSRLSFGFHRAEILGALISVLLIWVLTGVLVYEACWRIANPEPVNGKIMFIVATGGLMVNGIMGVILLKGGHGHSHGLPGSEDTCGTGSSHGHSHGPKKSAHSHSLNGDDHGHSHATSSSGSESKNGVHTEIAIGHQNDGHIHVEEVEEEEEHHHENLNIRAALLHVLGDAVQSVGVMIAAGFIWYEPEWHIADPLCTFLFSVLVLFTTTRLIKQSIGVLMEGVPEGIAPDEVEEALLAVPGVIAVHDLHIWSLSVGRPALSVHLYARDDAAHVLANANRVCSKKFNIHHSTIQVERQHDAIECNDAFVPELQNLDLLAKQEFSELGLVSPPDTAEQV